MSNVTLCADETTKSYRYSVNLNRLAQIKAQLLARKPQ